MKNTINTIINTADYANAIRNYTPFFKAAFDEATKIVGNLSDEIISAFMKQYEERTGWSAERESTIAGIVDVVASKILAENTDEKNVTKWQHDLWSWHRLNEGWEYAPVKDKANKKNPCLKDFSLLTEEEVEWDKMFCELYNKVTG